MRRFFLSALVVVAGLLAILLIWLLWNEPRMIYMPIREIEIAPDQAGLPFEEVALTTSDGVKLHAWLLPSPTNRSDSSASPSETTAAAARPPTVLLFHGNAGNISHRLDKARILHECGADVLLVDYRGYGRSEGRPSEAGFYRDAEAAYRYLTDDRRLDPRSIVFYGESLGGAVAAELASRFQVGGLVMESAFTSVPDVAQAMVPFLPVRWLVRHRYDSVAALGRVRAPVLVFHSRDDEYFPMRHAERLAAAAGDRVRMVALRGGHNDAFLISGDTYREALHAFLTRTSPGP